MSAPTPSPGGPPTGTGFTGTDFTGQARPYAGGDPYADYRAPAPGDLPFAHLPDLADRRLGGSVTAASDEFFAERENLVRPEPAHFDPAAYGHKGKVMDGWETRRRRGASADAPHPAEDDHDWAVVRLGVPGVVRGLVVDTAHFRGNHPAAVRVEATADPAGAGGWTELLPRTPVGGHAANAFPVHGVERRFTHLRLSQYPDGGVARLRAHGEPVADPAWLAALGTFDLAALEHGGAAEDASDRFYSPPAHVIHPGRSREMHEGWETRRRRDHGHDWLRLRLAGQGVIRAVEIDTGNYKGNAPGWATLSLLDADTPGAAWRTVLRGTPLRPDAVHRLVLPDAGPATHARLDVHPDGGVARLRLHGSLTEAGARRLAARYRELTD
ncbi:allantoicase [Streptomyces millisiae]|uniref:Probable allantoicase n=1 Tax=Streptomyces millisiae TaxID=3075542 RepID=A0ABU2LYU6_9ACTN|nr:allantoicase [Streptomyces sp. DSM 44918]MDT0322183.1 allantoicase [Streptomyces sp. DSM 44918]